MTPNEAMKELSTIATSIFPKDSSENLLPETRVNQLRELIESMLQRHNYPVGLELHEDLSRCKV
jgi:hypothetical protein